MITNPLSATKEIQENYVNFYKANFALGNEKLSKNLEKLKENNRLWKSPFISITQNYVHGQKDYELMTDAGINEDVLKAVGVKNYFKHQELAIKNIVTNGKNTIISSGTGSGKTESFLIPVLDECTKSDVDGIKAIIVYPMNALAGDQVTRLRNYLFVLNKIRKNKGQRPITFGVYNGATPHTAYVGKGLDPKLNLEYQCPNCKKDSLACKNNSTNTKCILYCKEESEIEIDFQLLTRKELRENPPDILITSYVMLDRILLRSSDTSLFQNNKVKYLVLDEMHTYEGAKGVDVSLLLRRLKRRLDSVTPENLDLHCIGTSATMSKSKDPIQRKQEIADFAKKLFGVTFSADDVFEGERKRWELPTITPKEKIEKLPVNDDIESNFSEENFSELCEKISGSKQDNDANNRKFLGKILLENEFFQFLIQNLDEPQSVDEIKEILKQNQKIASKIENFNDPQNLDDLIWSYLKAGSIAKNPSQNLEEPLLRVSIHNFFRVLPPIFMCTNQKCDKIFFVNKDKCDECEKKVEELGVCRNCSREFYVSKVSQSDLEDGVNIPERNEILKLANNEVQEESHSIKRFSYEESENDIDELWYSVVKNNESIDDDNDNDDDNSIRRYKKCLDCGSFSPKSYTSCINKIHEERCNSENLILIETYPPKSDAVTSWRPRDCPFCHYSYGSGWAITKFQMAEKQATVNLFNMIYNYVENRKMLIFTDSRQDAAELAGWLDFAHEDTAIKQLMVQKLSEIIQLEKEPIGFDRFQDIIIDAIEEEWYSYNFEAFDRDRDEFKTKIVIENASKLRLSLERLGLIQYNYRGLDSWEKFKPMWLSALSGIKPNRKASVKIQNILDLTSSSSQELNKFIITILNMIRTEQAITGLENRRGENKTYVHGFERDVKGTSKPVDIGVKIHNIIKNKNKFIKYTQKVFELTDDDDVSFIIESIWNFMEKRGFIVPRGLRKYRFAEPKTAHMVSTSKLLVSIPNQIQKCPECKNNYMNLPNNKCRNFTRQKICSGKTNESSFEEFCKNTGQNHFFKQFKETLATRMSVKEHTAAIPEEEKNRIQVQFMPFAQEDRKVDVVVATPTLELGVDIGDLSTVCLYKSPPSPANYLQRVGRAGRRSGVSFINTFFFNSPIDEFYYRNPQDLIKGNFNPPPIKIENSELIGRHLNALILEQLVFSETNSILSKSVTNFLSDRKENMAIIELEIKNNKEEIVSSIREVLSGLDISEEVDISNYIQNKLDNFEKELNEALDSFVKEAKDCEDGIKEYTVNGDQNDVFDSNKLNQLHEKRLSLKRKPLENHLFDENILPRFAFPGLSVQIEDMEGNQMHGGRSRQIAIVEFAPNCEITYRKKKYKSVGIDLTNPDRGFFYICNHCEKFYSKQSLTGEECPFCKKIMNTPESLSSISPKKFFIQKTPKSLSENSDYREAQINTFLPKSESIERDPLEIGNYLINAKKFGNVRLLLIVNGVYTDYADPGEIDQRQGQKLDICNKCGRVKNSRKNTHYPLNQKFNRKRQLCSGSWEPLALHHEMPTNVISIKINEKIEEEKLKTPSLKFLTTLKNAIIFAGQSICESGEGEIAGIVKDDEIILYDNVDGGAGYVDLIFDRFEEVLQRANRIVDEEYETYHENCDHGCLRCLWSYRNKRDIKLIDKQLILPLLQECSNISIPKSNLKKKLIINQTKEFEKVLSLPGDKNVVKEIKDILRSSNKKIILYTPLLSKNKIDFSDEGLKNWADILGSIRTGEKSIAITLFLKKLNLIDHSILRKLIESGIEVFEIKHEYLEKNMEKLGNSFLLRDPHENTRKIVQISGGLTEKLGNEVSSLRYSTNDLPIDESVKWFEEILENSKKINIEDLTKLESIDNFVIKRRDNESIEKAVVAFDEILDSANYEIKLYDGYMRNHDGSENLRFYLSYLCNHLKENVVIQIITCGHNHNEVKRDKLFFESIKHNVEIISYDQLGYQNPIHRRFLVVDKQKSIHLDKGLRFLFDYQKFGNTNNETSMEIHKSRNIINDDLKRFEDYWDYSNTTVQDMKEWPKIDTRRKNES